MTTEQIAFETLHLKQSPKITFEDLVLSAGAHTSPDQGMCVLEAVAYFRGRPFSDRPECVSPTVGAFLRAWNDSLNDEDRQKLKPYVFRVIDTNTGADDEVRRGWMATDWLVRTFAPSWLDLAGLGDHAQALRALPELTSAKLSAEAAPAIEAARSAAAAAWDAARDAAWDAARDAAWDAAGDAARAAAGDAARDAAWAAARDAARDAAWAAARAAAGDAAGDAARDALRPTVVALQESAFDLLDRMIAVGAEGRLP